MSQNTYCSVLISKGVTVITALLRDGELNFLGAEKVNSSEAAFDAAAQIEAFKSDGYNVHVIYRDEQIYLISAIPPNSYITHPQWIFACADFLGLNP